MRENIGRRATIAEIQAADPGMEVDVGFQRVVDRLGQLLTPDVRRAERPLWGQYRRSFREESTMPQVYRGVWWRSSKRRR